MLVKIAFTLLLCIYIAAAVPVPKPETGLDIPADEGLKVLEAVIGGLTDRFSNAYVATYNEEKQSMTNTLESVKQTGQMGVETGASPVPEASPSAAALPDSIKSIQLLQDLLGGLNDRFGKAYVKTYDDQKGSIDETIKSIKDMGKLGVESGVNLMKNGLEFFFIVPTFTKNVAAEEQKRSFV
ncbi:hypothetical protein TKK_0001823 [Trichogramma kaykai]